MYKVEAITIALEVCLTYEYVYILTVFYVICDVFEDWFLIIQQ